MCCCPSHDPMVCYDLRIYGYYPARRREIDEGEECVCGCHLDYADEDDPYEDES